MPLSSTLREFADMEMTGMSLHSAHQLPVWMQNAMSAETGTQSMSHHQCEEKSFLNIIHHEPKC
jgi:hypothetical protein